MKLQRMILLMLGSALLGVVLSSAVAQEAGEIQPGDDEAAAAAPAAPRALPARTGNHRRNLDDLPPIPLAFDDTPVEDTFELIMEITGKVVMPLGTGSGGNLKNKRITIRNDKQLPRDEALDMLFRAFKLNGIGVIESPDVIVLYDMVTTTEPPEPYSIIGPDEDIMARQDKGALVVKVYRLEYRAADSVLETIQTELPSTTAKAVADVSTNQLLIWSDLGYCQHVQDLIRKLDVKSTNVRYWNHRLLYTDANEIANNILELFEESGDTGARSAVTAAQRRIAEARGQAAPRQPGEGEVIGPQVELRVTVITQRNMLSVRGDTATIDQISDLVVEYWDKPISPKVTKVYSLKFTDPLKVRDLLQSLLEGGSTGGGGGSGPRRQPGAAAAGLQGSGSADQAVRGIYRVEAYPDTMSVVVIAKTQESLDFLDEVVQSIDRPIEAAVPDIIPLKHADAGEVADVINVILAETGARVTMTSPETGLTGLGVDQSQLSDSDASAVQGATTPTEADRIEFPWQTARAREDQAEPSPLIGKVRVVPIFRQNALAVLGPPEASAKVRDMIVNQFDKPGRQVLISAVIAEVELNDELALGVRFSSDVDNLVSSLSDNSVRAGISASGTSEGILPDLFDSSILDATVDVGVLVQAINQLTNVRILQEPRVFTADNQEAAFFDGQDVPFISDSTTTDISGVTQSFEYVAVGVKLNVRPRITDDRNVDMEVNLELSSVVPGVTLFGGAILDRRETYTKVIVRNGQTIMISGILRDEETRLTRKVPFLGDIPLIGEVFKSRENSTRRTELIAFITPLVIDNPMESEELNRRERERLRNLSQPIDKQKHDPDDIRNRIVPEKRINPPETDDLGRLILEEPAQPAEPAPDEQ